MAREFVIGSKTKGVCKISKLVAERLMAVVVEPRMLLVIISFEGPMFKFGLCT